MSVVRLLFHAVLGFALPLRFTGRKFLEHALSLRGVPRGSLPKALLREITEHAIARSRAARRVLVAFGQPRNSLRVSVVAILENDAETVARLIREGRSWRLAPDDAVRLSAALARHGVSFKQN